MTKYCNDFEKVTVADSAVGLTAGKVALADSVTITVETANVRVRMDGVAPDATTGILLEPGDTLEVVTRENLTNLKAIRTGAVSGVMQVSYFTHDIAKA